MSMNELRNSESLLNEEFLKLLSEDLWDSRIENEEASVSIRIQRFKFEHALVFSSESQKNK